MKLRRPDWTTVLMLFVSALSVAALILCWSRMHRELQSLLIVIAAYPALAAGYCVLESRSTTPSEGETP